MLLYKFYCLALLACGVAVLMMGDFVAAQTYPSHGHGTRHRRRLTKRKGARMTDVATTRTLKCWNC